MAPIEPNRLAECFQTQSQALVLYARQWLDVESAEDVVQEVFLSLMRLHREPENLKAWLFRSARNAVISRWRKTLRHAEHHQRIAANHRAWFVESPSSPVDPQAVQAALEKLDHDQRELVVLRIWGQMTLGEISGIMGRPVSTLFDRYSSALTVLKRELEKP